MAAGAALGLLPIAKAQRHYDVGVSDTEIKIGQTMPYSGPASALGTIGRAEAVYFKIINDQGGIHGRKILFISLDDGYNPAKTVEMTRRLVELDQVLFLVGAVGTPSNSAIHRYVNQKKVPHLFLASGASKWNDPKNFPWTMGYSPSYRLEAGIYAKHILATRPNARIAVLYQNDDYGKDYLQGFADTLGSHAKRLIVAQASYEVTDPTVDSQIVTLQSSGADTFFNVTTPKFGTLAIRKAFDTGWKPTHYLNSVASSIGSVLKPAGLEKAIGLICATYGKDPSSPIWANDTDTKEFVALMRKHLPDLDPNDGLAVYGWSVAQLTVHLLKQCGDDLTRDNVMRQATNLRKVQLPMMTPGITVSTSPTDYALFDTMDLRRFDGKNWAEFGGLYSAK
ncbi:ABC transporter substrate-binding protein [Ramlibacter alkalitolerans]|uniref:ABC transporter substrate-binding protein n=2 Tax=Ramlibacter alkalitolerans TaxID=2039631 RepID=A0ABS1JL33_9BURK|nr:ABC transporter substrate-binding protein [Ramlibacter alkalitolerans]MBL0424947.1 ABC transporter substrate-binding protein [Ramlibacter alkalitolerans]